MAVTINASTSAGLVQTADTSGVLQLQTNSGTTAVTIDTSQNVGIGTTSTSGQKFAVYQQAVSDCKTTISVNTGTYSPYTAFVNNTVTTVGTENSSGGNLVAGSSPYSTVLANNGAYPISFGTNNTERMRIDSSGNLLVGTTSTNGTGWTIYGPTSLGYAVSQGGSSTFTHISFQTLGSQKGFIQTVGGTTNYNGSSDYRLKENVEILPNALETIAALKPVKFNWKLDGSEGYSFIAHELQEVVPQAVCGTKDEVDADGNPIYQGIDQSKLVPILTKAIQEQQTIINDLKARVTALEAK